MNLTIKGDALLAPNGTQLITGNAYAVTIYPYDSAEKERWIGRAEALHIVCTQEDTDAELDVELTEDPEYTTWSGTIPALPRCLSVRLSVTGHDAGGTEMHTETLALPCTASIRDLGTTAYSAPYDAYNAMMELACGRMNGRWTRYDVDRKLAELAEHPLEELNRAAYKRAIAALSPETKLTGKLELTDETEIDVTNDIITSSSVTLSTSAIRDNAVLPGAVPAAELTATVTADADIPHSALRGAQLALQFNVMQENGQWGEVPLGTHTVYTVGDDTATGTPITAYDAMKWLDGITLTAAGFEAGKVYSPGQIISKITTAAGIPYTQNPDFDTTLTNNGASRYAHSYVVVALGTLPTSWGWKVAISNADPYTTDAEIAEALAERYGVSVTYEGTVTYKSDLPTTIASTNIAYRVMYGGPLYNVMAAGNAIMTTRDLLMHTLTTLNALGYIDRATGELTVKAFAKTDATTEINQNKVLRQRVSRLNYQLYCLTTVCDYPDRDGVMVSEERREYTLWGDGATVVMPSNPLLSGLVADDPRAEIFELVNALADALDPVTFRPARVETYGDPSIQPWEWITAQAKDGSTTIPAASLTWRYRGTQTIDTGGTDAVNGLELSQAERAVIANKITASQSSQNTMRTIYGHLMKTHEGLHSFRHAEIGHYTYAQIEGKEPI